MQFYRRYLPARQQAWLQQHRKTRWLVNVLVVFLIWRIALVLWWQLNFRMAAMDEVLKQPFKAYCLGRFVVDIPLDGLSEPPFYSSSYNSNAIAPLGPMTQAQFDELVNARELELKNSPHATEGSLLKRAVRPQPNVLILMARGHDTDTTTHDKEAYFLKDGMAYKFLGGSGSDNVDQVVTETAEIISRVRLRKDDEIPNEPGFCMPGGFIPDGPTPSEHEEASIILELKGKRNVELEIESTTTHVEEPGLVARFPKAAILASNPAQGALVQFIREGSHNVGPIQGEQMVVKSPVGEHATLKSSIQAIFESTPIVDSVMQPQLTVKIRNLRDHRQPVSLSNENTVRLFDRIVDSLRLRPVAGAKTSAADSPQLPLGELALTGKPCSQTGWWQCSEADSERATVAEGRRRRFEAGEPMPDVTMLIKPSLLQKLKGEQPTHRVLTVWSLVAYDATAQPATPAIASDPAATVSPPASDTPPQAS